MKRTFVSFMTLAFCFLMTSFTSLSVHAQTSTLPKVGEFNRWILIIAGIIVLVAGVYLVFNRHRD